MDGLGRRNAYRRLAVRAAVPLVLLATLATLAVAVWHDLPCANGHPAPDVLWTHGCYSDVLPLYGGRGLDQGAWPYLDSDVEYPVLIGGVMALVGLPVHHLNTAGQLLPIARWLGFETVDEGVVFFWGTAAVTSLLALLTSLLMVRLRAARPRDALLWALSPVLAVEAFINWDLVAVPFAVAVIYAWSRGRPGWAGVFAGLGAAAKIYPGLLVIALLLLCLRAGRRGRRPAAAVLLGASSSWLLVNLPVALMYPAGWRFAYSFSAERWIDWGSLWFLLDHLPHDNALFAAISPFWANAPILNQATIVLFGVLVAALGVLTLAAPRPPRVAQLAFLVVAAFLLTNKVWSPQFALWVVPLAVLARPRLRALLAWQLVEIVYLFDVMRTILGQRDDLAFVQFAAARWIAVALLAAAVVAEVLHPATDAVRGDDLADPDDGVLREPPHGLPLQRPPAGDADTDADDAPATDPEAALPVRSLSDGHPADDVHDVVVRGSHGWRRRTQDPPAASPLVPIDSP